MDSCLKNSAVFILQVISVNSFIILFLAKLHNIKLWLFQVRNAVQEVNQSCNLTQRYQTSLKNASVVL